MVSYKHNNRCDLMGIEIQDTCKAEKELSSYFSSIFN